MGGKRLLDFVFSGVEGKISDKQFRAHLMICCSRPTVFPDCSRPSGLKSSLNHVHLKIIHALKGQVVQQTAQV
jgi:hypothetical protein